KLALICSAFFLPIFQQAQAIPVVCVNCSSEWTQIANNIQLVSSQAELIRQTINQVKMIDDQIRNTKNLVAGDWGNIFDQLQRLNMLARHGESIAFSSANVMEDMNRIFKGYDAWNKNVTPHEFSTHYQNVSQTLGDTAMAAMNVANGVHQQQTEDNELIQRQQQASESATGRLQAIQAGNQLTAQMINQLQKMETLMSTQIQLTSTLVQAENEREQARQAQTDKFMQGNVPSLESRQLESYELKQF
ncbi:P-type conjugative transfer protein TrbJ, partial [Shewanella sairae]|uniref:P-type conjugative transfer protein TrbJ n=1 Tax=Shewanella sairae TaxID=190310 RepID=UPI001C7E8B9E